MRGIPVWALLLIMVIATSFYVGLSTDALVFAKAAQQLIYALTNRREDGTPNAYPTGAGTVYNPFVTTRAA